MSLSAVIRIGPVYTAERSRNPKWERPGRTFYWSGSLELLPTKEPRPLLVDHRKDRQVGVVNELSTIDWIDGPWICARVTVTDPPAWFKKGTRASFGHYDVYTVPMESVDAKRVVSAFVSEVSVLPPGVEPAEPLAEVLWIDKESPAAVQTSDRAAAGEVILGGQPIIRWNLGQVLAVGGVPVR